MNILWQTDGSILNAGTVLAGGVVGSLLGNRLPARIQTSLFGVLGLFTVLIGLMDALKTSNPLIVLGALISGTLAGELIDLEKQLQRLGDAVQKAIAREGSRVSEAFISSSLVFCVGPLSMLGALDNGLHGDIAKLAVKAVLDGFGALVFSAALGWGVLLSAVTVIVYQGGLSLAAHLVAPALGARPDAIVELTATGGLILVAIGVKLMGIRDLRAANMLPALAVAPAIVFAMSQIPKL